MDKVEIAVNRDLVDKDLLKYRAFILVDDPGTAKPGWHLLRMFNVQEVFATEVRLPKVEINNNGQGGLYGTGVEVPVSVPVVASKPQFLFGIPKGDVLVQLSERHAECAKELEGVLAERKDQIFKHAEALKLVKQHETAMDQAMDAKRGLREDNERMVLALRELEAQIGKLRLAVGQTEFDRILNAGGAEDR